MTCELLKGYRMLDLTDEKGALCGKIFADLGADVIKLEPPQGCTTRRIPPFLEDRPRSNFLRQGSLLAALEMRPLNEKLERGRPGPDTSLYFLAYQAGKRSVTLNLESADGRAVLAELAKKSDFLVESFPLGYLDSLGLGYEALSQLNPRLIYTSITPFGDRGPGKNYKAADIVSWASGGMMYLMGEEGRPPLQMSLPQAGLHAGGEAAVASLIAHYPRESTGRGQRAVVNMQACVVWTLMNEQAMPILHGNHLERTGVFVGSLDVRRKMVFRCRDGYISMLLIGGTGGAVSTRALVQWMGEKGFAADWMKSKDWGTWTPGLFMKSTEQDRQEIGDFEDRVERFFLTMSKREIYAEGLKRRILLAPVSTVADIAADEQLEARNFFVPLDHETLGRKLIFPGPFAKLSLTPVETSRRAPRLGEHNREVLGELLGFGTKRIETLRATGAI